MTVSLLLLKEFCPVSLFLHPCSLQCQSFSQCCLFLTALICTDSLHMESPLLGMIKNKPTLTACLVSSGRCCPWKKKNHCLDIDLSLQIVFPETSESDCLVYLFIFCTGLLSSVAAGLFFPLQAWGDLMTTQTLQDAC